MFVTTGARFKMTTIKANGMLQSHSAYIRIAENAIMTKLKIVSLLGCIKLTCKHQELCDTNCLG